MNWEKICKVNDKKYMYIFYSIFAVIIVGVIIASINFSYLKLTKKQQQDRELKNKQTMGIIGCALIGIGIIFFIIVNIIVNKCKK